MNILKRKEVWIIIVLLSIVLINRVTAYVSFKYSDKGFEATVEDIQIKEEVQPEQEEVLKRIKVDISGAIHTPGVYELSETDRIEDVIELAGGLTEDANRNLINQAEHLYDGQKIIVLRVGETIEAVNGGVSGPININTATIEQLTTLSGIGEKTAEKIIAYRQKNGNFTSVDDLTKVSGIGASKLDGIRDGITTK